MLRIETAPPQPTNIMDSPGHPILGTGDLALAGLAAVAEWVARIVATLVDEA